jgi:WD40 repeat protein
MSSLWDLRSGANTGSLTHSERAWHKVFSPDGVFLYAALSDGTVVQ